MVSGGEKAFLYPLAFVENKRKFICALLREGQRVKSLWSRLLRIESSIEDTAQSRAQVTAK